MSFAKAIATTLLVVIVSYVAEITATFCSYADQAVYSFADVANVRELPLAIRSNNPEWLVEGMKFFAYKDTGNRWRKRILTWSVMNVATNMSRTKVSKIMSGAFKKWAKRSPFTFRQISRGEKPDIRVQFGSVRKNKASLSIVKYPEGKEFDTEGVTIIFNDTLNWANLYAPNWYNLRFSALFEIGRALGLGASEDPRSVLFGGSVGSYVNGRPTLGADDIRGIQALYKGSSGSGSTAQQASSSTSTSSSSE